MGGRYWITGAQLGVLDALVGKDADAARDILNTIGEEQFIGDTNNETKLCPKCGSIMSLCPKCGVVMKLKMVRPPIKGARKRIPMKVCPICHVAILAEK